MIIDDVKSHKIIHERKMNRSTMRSALSIFFSFSSFLLGLHCLLVWGRVHIRIN